MICEDDISFVSSRFEINYTVREFHQDDELDVLLISYVAFDGVKISMRLRVTFNAKATTFYISKKRALPFLVSSAERSIELLSRVLAIKHAAIDIVLKPLRRNLWFAVSTRVRAIQIKSYSYIEHKVINYFFGY